MNTTATTKTLMFSAAALALSLCAPAAFAGGSGAACNFSVTNNYNAGSAYPRRVFAYKGDDSIMSSSYQYKSVDYGDTEDFNCGSGQSKCKIKWTAYDNSWAVVEWTLGSKSVDCDDTYVITKEES